MKYDTPKQHLRRLRIERFLNKLKCLGFILMGLAAIWVLYACLSGWDIPKRLNECYQSHSQEYCNKAIK